MSKTFISYASEDRSIADRICSSLEAEGLHCWIAPRDIRPGAEWESAIVEALSASRLLLVVFSSEANGSSDVLNEVRCAARRRLPLLLLRIEDLEPSLAMEYYLGGRQWLDGFEPPIEQHLPEVVKAVRTLAATSPEALGDEASVLRSFADAGDAAAVTNMGLLSLERGDRTEAERWFRQGAEAGDALAATNVGLLVKERDSEQAQRWFRGAAEAGDALAATNLGLLVKERDRTEAERWFLQAAEAGDALAATNLGLLLKERGDRAEAERWLNRGAEAGDAMAAANLGLLLEERGDVAEAARWLCRGADAGDPFAASELRRLLAGRGGF